MGKAAAFCFLICSLMLTAATVACADTINFKSGKKVDGNITSVTDSTVTMEIYGVTEMTYDLSEIQDINGYPVPVKPAEAPAEVVPAEPPSPSYSKEPVEEALEPVAAPEKSLFAKDKAVLSAGIIAVVMTFLGIIIFALLAIYVFFAVCLQMIAKKTGAEPSWLAWIPVANMFLTCKIAGLSYLWLLALLLPFVNVLVSIYMWYRISEARGKPGLLALLLLVPVANLFFVGYLAFSGSSTGAVQPPVRGEEPASPLQDRPYRPPLE